jgi:hypothetical protein
MAKYDAWGTRLEVENPATPGTFTPVANLRNTSGPEMDTQVRDATTHDSPSRFMEKRAGFIDPGSFTFDFLSDPNDGTHQFMIAQQKTGQVLNFRLIYPSTPPAQVTFAGFVRRWAVQAPHDDMLAGDGAIEITGEPIFPGEGS